jgi:hypothetical protein
MYIMMCSSILQSDNRYYSGRLCILMYVKCSQHAVTMEKLHETGAKLMTNYPL